MGIAYVQVLNRGPYRAIYGNLTEEGAPIVRNLITSEAKSPVIFHGDVITGSASL